jgi:Ni,Fe-hydrogenase III small subunit/ferredoxin
MTRGLRDGVVTTRWPRGADDYFDAYASAVEVSPGARIRSSDGAAADDIAELCPSGAISVDQKETAGAASGGVGRAILLDRGRCILCGRCVQRRPDLFSWAQGSAVSRLGRSQLVVGEVTESEENVQALRRSLRSRVRALGRSVHIRHVDVGSDGSDEWEVQALTNPVYDVHRLGIFMTASPRHADILLLTGIGASSMAAPLRRTRDAMPEPVVVIAAGADAVSGGMFHGSYAGHGGVGALVDVDVWIPGSPATPFALMHGILLALGRVPDASETGSRDGPPGSRGRGS